MTTQQVIEVLNQRHIILSLSEKGTVHYRAPSEQLTPEIVTLIREHKTELTRILSHPDCEQTIQEIEAAYHFLCKVERYANHWPEVEPVVRSWDNQTLEKNAKQYRRRLREHNR